MNLLEDLTPEKLAQRGLASSLPLIINRQPASSSGPEITA